jgi:hypothetical protein
MHVEDDVDGFPGWRKPVLYKRLGEGGGREARRPARGQAFLRRSRYKTVFGMAGYHSST